MKSMTGHGRGTSTKKGWHVTVECASVNRKGIEVAFTLPKQMTLLEPRLREQVVGAVSRGRVNVSVVVENSGTPDEQSVIDREAAHRALRELRALRDELSLPGEISLELLLRSPGVLKTSVESAPVPEDLWPAVESALAQALDRLCFMRRKEGMHLVSDLLKRVRLLENAAKAIRLRVPAVQRQRREHLKKKLEELGVSVAASDPAVARELALMAERSDITEELTRLESHFAQCREALAGTEPAGRTLDYLAQEMFREFNTLGNKAADAAISRRVVQSKAELDRIREQVANLE
ncbi:MAG: YicC/YloC family endoribonuclease [bacterium]